MILREPGDSAAADRAHINVVGYRDQAFPTVTVNLAYTSLLATLSRALVETRTLPDVAVLGAMDSSEFGTYALTNLRTTRAVHDALILTLTPQDAADLGHRLIARAYNVDPNLDPDDLREAR